jgi:hypothetical protein
MIEETDMESLLREGMIKTLAGQKGERHLNGSRKVILIAVDGNWGPPVSGRFDTDFLNIWAVVMEKGNLVLQGARDGAWNIELPFESMEKVGELKLYKLHLSGQSGFPNEFVVRFDTGTESFYDNNQGRNYQIPAYGGYFVSAAPGEGCIMDLDGIHPVNLYSGN